MMIPGVFTLYAPSFEMRKALRMRNVTLKRCIACACGFLTL